MTLTAYFCSNPLFSSTLSALTATASAADAPATTVTTARELQLLQNHPIITEPLLVAAASKLYTTIEVKKGCWFTVLQGQAVVPVNLIPSRALLYPQIVLVMMF